VSDIVECHSGYEYADRPTAFYWQEQRWEVIEILARWRTPEGKHFRVNTQHNQIFEILYVDSEDAWQIKTL
jgi:hypothetical protein